MKIHAYQETYLSRVQGMLGDAFDYAVNSCEIAGADFLQMFVGSSISDSIARGEPKYILGKSGIEVALDIIFEATGKELEREQKTGCFRSREYWIGWALAYYQWYSDRRFMDIFKVVTYAELERIYSTLHEADISKFVDIMDRRVREYFVDTNLKRFRRYLGITQAELARRSGISLRSIQMYEQRKKDINKASLITVYKLAKTFGCAVEDLIEH